MENQSKRMKGISILPWIWIYLYKNIEGEINKDAKQNQEEHAMEDLATVINLQLQRHILHVLNNQFKDLHMP